MARSGSLTRQLAAVADAIGPIVAPAEHRTQLHHLCELARLGLGAASVSVSRVDHNDLVFEAASGEGAAGILDVRLPSDRGFAGYVARTGQSLAIDDVGADPRFARDVAERSGYVPTSMLVVPVVDDDDEVIGVLSVLDRTGGFGDPLATASATARVAAPLIATSAAVARLGPVLLRALADAVADGDSTLVPALRRLSDDLPEADAELAGYAELLGALHVLPSPSRQAIQRVLRETISLAAPRRRW
jgi:GAF domain-containing protein